MKPNKNCEIYGEILIQDCVVGAISLLDGITGTVENLDGVTGTIEIESLGGNEE